MDKPTERPIVFIVEDDASVRESLALLLELKGFTVAAFASAEAFLAAYQPAQTGCLVLDLRLPGMSGLALQAELAAQSITLPVIIVTAHGDVAAARMALKAGAVDFIEKPVDDELLIATIGVALEREAIQRQQTSAAAEWAARLERLSRREREVLDYVIAGKQNREIAELLAISVRTVEVYKARMMEKLQARTVPDLIRLALTSPQKIAD
ncbi:MAG: response regulator [Gammaproteobacteria bacterium]